MLELKAPHPLRPAPPGLGMSEGTQTYDTCPCVLRGGGHTTPVKQQFSPLARVQLGVCSRHLLSHQPLSVTQGPG